MTCTRGRAVTALRSSATAAFVKGFKTVHSCVCVCWFSILKYSQLCHVYSFNILPWIVYILGRLNKNVLVFLNLHSIQHASKIFCFILITIGLVEGGQTTKKNNCEKSYCCDYIKYFKINSNADNTKLQIFLCCRLFQLKKKKKDIQSNISEDSYLNTAQTCWKCVPCSLLGASLYSWWTDAAASSALPCWCSCSAEC